MASILYYTILFVVLVYSFSICDSEESVPFPNPHRGPENRNGLFYRVQDYAVSLVFKTLQVLDAFACVSACLEEPSCQSVNFDTSGHPKHLCELSDKKMECSPSYKEPRPGFIYYAPVENWQPCSRAPCKNGGTCEPVCGAPGFVCRCGAFNKGQYCQLWTVDISSCQDIFSKTSYRTDMAYTYMIDNKQTDIYCHLSSDLCGSRGWTLTMKTDGSKNTFAYGSELWSNKNAFELSAGKTGFDNHETKMPSYWAMHFQSLCVGMKVGNNLNWVVIPFNASSLYDVIADGIQRNFSIGRDKWMSLISGSSLQNNCNAEGFNVGVPKEQRSLVRIGFVANDQDECLSPDSDIGFGLSWSDITCGNYCNWRYNCGSGPREHRAFGYILIK